MHCSPYVSVIINSSVKITRCSAEPRVLSFSFNSFVKFNISNSYTMDCPPVRGDNPRAFASGLSYVLFYFINLTQAHNFKICAQDIFTFRRLSVFTVSFTGILQVLMR